MALTVEPPPSKSAEAPATPPAGRTRRARIQDKGPSLKNTSQKTDSAAKLKPNPKPTESRRTQDRTTKTTNQNANLTIPRATSPNLATETQATLATTQPSLNPARPSVELQDNSTMPSHATSLGDVANDQLKHLESLLDSVLATLVIISATTLPVALNNHCQQVLSTPADPAQQPATTKGSYADAVTTPNARPITQTTTPSPAGRPSRRLSSPNKTSSHHSSIYRLIIRWPNNPIPQSSQSLEHFIQDMEDELSDNIRRKGEDTLQPKIAGGNVTKTGNIILHARAPLQASTLISYLTRNNFSIIRDAATTIPNFENPGPDACLSVDLDVPWSGFVVHNIPAAPLIQAMEADGSLVFWKELDARSGIKEKDIRDTRVLCRDEEMRGKVHLSIRIMVDNPQIFDCLCRDGMFFFGTHCRVSRYRPRKR
ncbi:hypothetical protein BJ912DRAFT_968526 [Pholiota molesta]|nr:hypothetical protein BJ912DRAFT_968526 [Pholiota molesta]